MDYKKTLNIFHTDFKMKGDLGIREVFCQQNWLAQEIYQKLLIQNQDGPQWVLHDGPPYANGSIHIGHAVNKILKDFIVRIKFFQGYYSPFIPGFDTHGLPIEWALIKQGKNLDPHLDPVTKRTNCQQFADSQIAIQTKQFMRLGLLSDFRQKYLTYDQQFVIDQLNIFAKILAKNLIYRSLKPVYWSCSSQTALAEAEVVYAPQQSPSLYVKFATVEEFQNIPANTNLVIWTTTPWTLPANLAIALHPEKEYVLVMVDNSHYLLMGKLLPKLAVIFGWKDYQTIATYQGQELVYLKYYNPLINEQHFVILADYVSDEDGTGLVHNAPGFGLDDYLSCQKYQINIHCPVNGLGHFTNQVKIPNLQGLFYKQANPIIIELLQQHQMLLFASKIVHNVAHDWRTNQPLIYLATKQWFINIDAIKNEVITACSSLKTYPPKIKNQLVDTVIKRKEWCISRQRIWGVPIPILFTADDKPILDLAQINYTIKILKEQGINAWFSWPAEAFLLPKYHHLKPVSKSQDIMDVWFDSGTSYTILSHHSLRLPAQLYLEGSDQFRGWFNSSLITSLIVSGHCPYQKLISHGFVLDENGLKMSKSKGNVVDPNQVVQKFGADVLRLWIASSDYTEDLRLGAIVFDQVVKNYRKIRNSLFRFPLSNLVDFDPDLDYQTTLSAVHQYLIFQLNTMVDQALVQIRKFNFSLAIKGVNNFLNFYSSWYLNLVKDLLYCEKVNSLQRRQVQTVLYQVVFQTTLLLAPFLPHTTEEVYQTLKIKDKKLSVHLENWKQLTLKDNKVSVDSQKWAQFFGLKNLVYEEIEKARNQGILKQSYEAKVTINSSYYDHRFSIPQYQQFLMVSEVEFVNHPQLVVVTKTTNQPCGRCKLYYPKQAMTPQLLCQRCQIAIKN